MEAIDQLIEQARAKGSEKQYLGWVVLQPSAYSGRFSGKDWDSGISYCDPCHYRTADNAGIATKPEYWAIPLTRDEHLRQHQVGQFAFMRKDWWEEQVRKHLELWVADEAENQV